MKHLFLILYLFAIPVMTSAQGAGGHISKPDTNKGTNRNNQKHNRPTSKTISVGGMEYKIERNGAILSKGKVDQEITIPEYITVGSKRTPVVEVGIFAFNLKDANKITTITFSKNIKKLNTHAFEGCTGITQLHIPSNIIEMVKCPFHDCKGLKKITVDPNNPVFDSRSNCNAIIETKTGRLLKGGTNTVIPSGVTIIGEDAFYGCEFASVRIPEGVKVIEGGAYHKCKNLSSVVLPSTLEELGSAFTDCTKLEEIILPKSLKSLGYSFATSGLKRIYIPENVETIKVNPFEYCGKLQEIVVDKNNRFFDSRMNCNAIIRKSDNTLICGCKNTIIPMDTKVIGKDAFVGCVGMLSVQIPEGVRIIDKNAFFGCHNLKTVSIPSSVEIINNFAFRLCALKTIRIPEKVKTIEDYVFPDDLEEAYIPKSCKISAQLERLFKIVRY